jgi:hypothetical protein
MGGLVVARTPVIRSSSAAAKPPHEDRSLPAIKFAANPKHVYFNDYASNSSLFPPVHQYYRD